MSSVSARILPISADLCRLIAPFPDDGFLSASRLCAQHKGQRCRHHWAKIDFFTTSQA